MKRRVRRAEKPQAFQTEHEANLVRNLMRRGVSAQQAAQTILARHPDPSSLNIGFLQAIANGKIRIR